MNAELNGNIKKNQSQINKFLGQKKCRNELFIFINKLVRNRRFLFAVGLDMKAGGAMTGMTGRVVELAAVVAGAPEPVPEAGGSRGLATLEAGTSEDVVDDEEDRADEAVAARIGLLAGVAVLVTTSSSGLAWYLNSRLEDWRRSTTRPIFMLVSMLFKASFSSASLMLLVKLSSNITENL